MTLILILLAIIVVIILVVIVSYNRIVALKNNREQAFSDIDVQLNLRYDLVPNLVNTVKGYAKHESETLEEITKMRASVAGPQSIDDKIKIDNQFTGALKSLFAVSENYPQLKANENFLQLQNQLADIENKIAASRRFFNNATKEFNTSLMTFPANALNSSFFHFQAGTFFDLGTNAEEMRKNVAVNF